MYMQTFKQAEHKKLDITDSSLEVDITDPLTGLTLSIPFNHIILVYGGETPAVLFLVEPGGTNAFPQQHPTTGFLFLTPSSSEIVQQHPLLSTYYREGENKRHIDIIVNETSGDGTADAYCRATLLLLLSSVACKYSYHSTKGVDDASRIVREIMGKRKEDGETDVQTAIMIMGGDGTVHEVLQGLLIQAEEDGLHGQGLKDNVDLILSPFGTANALYYHLFPPESSSTPSGQLLSPLYSLVAFLRSSPDKQSGLEGLSLALNTLPSGPTKVITSVVSSAALHSALLHDAEALRSTHPGVSRFKIAAQQNVATWWKGKLMLLPEKKTGISLYDSEKKRFVEVEKGKEVLVGPFSYFVSSLVSRFERDFVIAPLRSPLSPLAPSSIAPTLDLIIIRPLRNSTISTLVSSQKQTEAAESFVEKVLRVMGGAYAGGKHIDAKYEEHEGGESVVEVYRCGGFEWTPIESDDEKSNLVCLDGALRNLGRGGSLRTEALGVEQTGIRVWA